MFIHNSDKPRVLRIKKQDCTTPELLQWWAERYGAQKKEDLAKRSERMAYGRKHRDLIAPKWQLDKFLRVVLGKGRVELPDGFADFIKVALAGEIAMGKMSISGLPVDSAESSVDSSVDLEDPIDAPKRRGRPKNTKRFDAERKDTQG